MSPFFPVFALTPRITFPIIHSFENEAATVAHVLSYAPERRAEGMDIIEEPIPLVDVPVSIRMDSEPYDVSVQPHGEPLGYRYENGYLHMKLTLLDGHAMIVATRDGRG